MTNPQGQELQCPECGSADIGTDETGKFCNKCKCPVSNVNVAPADTKKKAVAKPAAKPKDGGTQKTVTPGGQGKKVVKKTVKKAAKKAVKKAPAPKKEKEKRGPAKSSTDNPFGSKLDSSAGKKIEEMFMSGKNWKEMSDHFGVTVNSIRFRFLSHLIEKYVVLK